MQLSQPQQNKVLSDLPKKDVIYALTRSPLSSGLLALAPPDTIMVFDPVLASFSHRSRAQCQHYAASDGMGASAYTLPCHDNDMNDSEIPVAH